MASPLKLKLLKAKLAGFTVFSVHFCLNLQKDSRYSASVCEKVGESRVDKSPPKRAVNWLAYF
jgi:hypothetical protein